MGQILHGCATTTEAVRRAIQDSQESLRVLARRYGINPKTVAKWKKRSFIRDLPTGPKEPRSTILTVEEEAIIVAFRRHTLLPLDDCLYALQATIPQLTRSSLHRCLQRHGISRLPEVEGDKPAKQKFRRYPIGYFHIDIAEVGWTIAWRTRRRGRGLRRRQGHAAGANRPALLRPAEVDHLVGNAAKARAVLGWQHKTSFEALVRDMVVSDLAAVKRESERRNRDD